MIIAKRLLHYQHLNLSVARDSLINVVPQNLVSQKNKNKDKEETLPYFYTRHRTIRLEPSTDPSVPRVPANQLHSRFLTLHLKSILLVLCY